MITIFWILVIAVFIYLIRQRKNKILRNAIGSFLIIFGLFIFNPLPSLDDILLYPLFSSVMGWDLTAQGIKSNILPYTVMTALIGFGVAYAGCLISGLKFTTLKNKIKRYIKW